MAEAPEASKRPALRGGETLVVALLSAEHRPKARPVPAALKSPGRPRARPLSRPIPVAVQEGKEAPKMDGRMRDLAAGVFVGRAPGAAVGEMPKLALARPAKRPPAALEDTKTVRLFFAAAGPRPSTRPEDMARIIKAIEAQRKVTPVEVRFTRKGSICGERSIKGKSVKPIAGKLRGCGVADPVRITSVQGVALSTPAVMDCGTAKALDSWVRKGLKPAFGRKGGGVEKIKVAAHYSCRTRNNKKGAKISEHGKGRAIDISGIYLKNGTLVTVLKHWRSKAYSAALKQAHKAACGPFGTVLGPNADRYHQDHFHFDTARYRSGSYCR
ncbi:extensin family protein [Alphaproteobacteria bacterium KMM 3653]|uniref:Extensin family protein n=2 Tax=Harenicola maris TaxID=2841044 RepID=A0AAP2G4L4_9RHOB|nr:extensin family protein [Harenicola maris]